MRQTHRAGEKMFIDFSGDGIDIVDPLSGECTRAKLFIAVLGASNLTYVEPVQSEDLPTWTGCHVRALEFFDGVADIWVPDNLKSGVKSPDRYEPDLNPTYAEPVLSEDLPTWTGCHVRALEFFGGVADIWVPSHLLLARGASRCGEALE